MIHTWFASFRFMYFFFILSLLGICVCACVHACVCKMSWYNIRMGNNKLNGPAVVQFLLTQFYAGKSYSSRRFDPVAKVFIFSLYTLFAECLVLFYIDRLAVSVYSNLYHSVNFLKSIQWVCSKRSKILIKMQIKSNFQRINRKFFICELKKRINKISCSLHEK